MGNLRSLCRCTISLSVAFLLLTSAVFADEQPNNTFGLTDNGDNTYDVTYVSDSDIYGFQFNVIPAVVTGVEGGDAAANGFTVSSGGGNVVLGFSFTGSFIPAGSGTLTTISTSGAIESLEGIVVSGIWGSTLNFTYWTGDDECTDDGWTAAIDTCSVEGTIDSDGNGTYDPPPEMKMKLIKEKTSTTPYSPTWPLMFKNVYPCMAILMRCIFIGLPRNFGRNHEGYQPNVWQHRSVRNRFRTANCILRLGRRMYM